MGKTKNFSLLSIFLIMGILGMLLSKSQPSYASNDASQPIGGYFIYASSNAETNAKKLDVIKATGADTIITFGSRLRPITLDGNGYIYTDGVLDATYKDCIMNGRTCVSAMQTKVTLNRVFTYNDKSRWNGKAIKCGNDLTVSSNGKSYTLLTIPTVDNGCSSANGLYDLVVIANTPEQDDAHTALSAGANSRGMKYYAGLPAPVYDAKNNWLPDLSYMATMEKFTDRFMLEFSSKYNTPGLGGFYHHFEQNLASAWKNTLDLYSMQNRMIAKHFGTSKYAMVSPYIDSRRSKGNTPEVIASNMMKIVATAQGVPMIMAPQDGVGSGFGALYYPTEANNPVDRYNIPFVGAGTNNDLYIAPFDEYYKAMNKALQGTGVQFWGNLEAFSSSKDGSNICTNQNNRGSTTKDRLNKQIQLGTPHTTKNISFMWDDYYTCKLSNGSTLGAEMLSRKADPIVVSASLDGGSLSVTGFNIGANISIEGNGIKEKLNVIRQNNEYGSTSGGNPGLDRTVLSLPSGGLKTSGLYTISASTSAGESTLPVYFDISGTTSAGQGAGNPASTKPGESITALDEKAAEAEKAKADAEKALSEEKNTLGNKAKGKFQPMQDITEADYGVTSDGEGEGIFDENKTPVPYILLALVPLFAGAVVILWKIRRA